ncbi:MAG TPA: hypothetical protein VLW75_08975, partial [Rhizomicrobium sp.]|nr:hypothetical protein [Rhizomicrobium sp.]
MSGTRKLKSLLWGSACAALFATGAFAETFDIPAGDLSAALDAYTAQTGIPLVVSSEAVRGSHTRGAHGELTAAVALSRILSGTGFVERRAADGLVIVPEAFNTQSARRAQAAEPVQLASASAAAVETVVVTSSKIKGDIQTVPIAITALSQEQLTSRQIAGGPDLVKEVPNLTFTKTNFSGYSIQIRGIGTQAISV